MNEKKTAVMTSMKDIVLSMEPDLKKMMPKYMDSGRLIQCILTDLRRNPKLAECTWQSVVGALVTLGQIGLYPIGGEAYLIPFKSTKDKNTNCTLVIGYRGYVKLFHRHESALSISMGTVFEGDYFEYEYGTNAHLRHVPKGENGKSTHHYAIAQIRGGGSVFFVWTHQECMEHGKKHSKNFSGENSLWKKESNAMCKKTVLLQLKKVLPLSYEMNRAFEADESIRKFQPGVQDFMELPNVAWDSIEEEQVSFPEIPAAKDESDIIPPKEPVPVKKETNENQAQKPLFNQGNKKKDLYDNAVELFEEIERELGQAANEWLAAAGFPTVDKINTPAKLKELQEKWNERGE